MPAYETLWRVVLLTYVHVAFRHVDAATRDEVCEVVEVVSRDGGQEAQTHPTVDNFARVRPGHQSPKTVQNTLTVRCLQEALRLYPPTKRIYRASASRTAAADVESMHHDERIWGPDALEFRPGRSGALTRRQKDAYMPFGVGKNACPAANGFGRRMVASLVVVLVTRLGTRSSGARIRFGDDELDVFDGTPLPTGRDDMGAWVISLDGVD
ncbi:hypothetical protein LX36DRAFT_662091 [Colletotrichum falcatum]|nr:hypothetical protein LX36DRAFT_662091 [Colletotrichum falcatum]